VEPAANRAWKGSETTGSPCDSAPTSGPHRPRNQALTAYRKGCRRRTAQPKLMISPRA
jgi:hypothetical protein